MGGIDMIDRGDCHQNYVRLSKDRKPICRARRLNPPGEVVCQYRPEIWNLNMIVPRSDLGFVDSLSHFLLLPAAENHRDQKEWGRFMTYLHTRDMVAYARFDFGEFYLLPNETTNFNQAKVAYRISEMHNAYTGQPHCELVETGAARQGLVSNSSRSSLNDFNLPHHIVKGPEERCLGFPKSSSPVGDHHSPESTTTTSRKKQLLSVELKSQKNYIKADPSYLQTLGQAHSAWLFGAIAELVDNSRDAKASKLDISIETLYFNKAGKEIPMLSIRDNGHGMNHQEIVRMTYFGHKQPGIDDPNHIGRFGVGFKTGAMRLGKDALVLTQTADSRSIAFLSQSLNEGQDNLEIPVVSYRKIGQYMELDMTVQSEETAKSNLKAIKNFSPFDKYLIGQKAGLFNEKDTGTQIYIWNLEEWGSKCALEWRDAIDGGSSFHQGDILIRSGRIRSRPGQMSQKVPLDYSLRSYLEVIFLKPQMRISVQGSLVKTRALAETLSKKHVETTTIMGKPVQLTLGHCQLEWEQMNCGIFLYWHGRLIEAYKRVGGMIHNGDIGRGVIGVVDVTDLMDEGNGRVMVHNNKQGFQDCELYADLEEWLGKVTDEYWDTYFDPIKLDKAKGKCKPDTDWVQCNKCRKWRRLTAGFNTKRLPVEWFCYMPPFEGRCDIPEEKVKGMVTISTRRTGYSRGDESSPGLIEDKPEQAKSPARHGSREVQSPARHSSREKKSPTVPGRDAKSPQHGNREVRSSPVSDRDAKSPRHGNREVRSPKRGREDKPAAKRGREYKSGARQGREDKSPPHKGTEPESSPPGFGKPLRSSQSPQCRDNESQDDCDSDRNEERRSSSPNSGSGQCLKRMRRGLARACKKSSSGWDKK